MKKLFSIIAILIPFFLSTCVIDKKALTIKDKYIFNNEFRMDGYYVRDKQEQEDIEIEYIFIRYFFQNGSCYQAGREDSVGNNQCFNIISRNTPYFWGYFTVNNDELYIQSYAPSAGSIGKSTIDQYFGKIENDTTIRFYRRISWWNEDIEIDELYHFHPCHNKPDSTNILMTF